MEGSPRPGRGWRRAVGLLLVGPMLGATSVGSLTAIPFIGLALVLGARRRGAMVAAGLAVVVAIGGITRGSMWHLERGWAVLLAGWFVSLTLMSPTSGFFSRALGAVAGAFAMVTVFLVAQPGSWAHVDWVISQGLMDGASDSMTALTALMRRLAADPEAALPAGLVNTLYQAAEQQGRAFPALLGLSSVAALGVAWWGYVRLSRGEETGLRPLRDFRFNDHLVWLFVAGVLVLVLGTFEGAGRLVPVLGTLEGAERAGTNIVIFMGGLYALRGLAVVAFLSGGTSLTGLILVLLVFLLLPPVLLIGALVVGLGDTWLDLRSRVETLVGNNDGRGG